MLSWIRHPSRGAGVVLAIGFLVLFVGGGARFGIGLTLKPLVEEFGWARGEVGVAVALFQIVSAGCMYVAGRLADQMNSRTVLGGGLLIGGIGIGAMSLVSQPWHAAVLYGLVFAIGNGVASLTPVSVMVTRAFPRRAGFANSVVSSGMSVGQLVMIAALAAILVAVGWRWVFLSLAVVHILLVPLIFAAIPRGAQAQAPHTKRAAAGLTLGEAARTGRFWVLMGIYAVCGFDDFFVSTHVAAFAQDRGIGIFLSGNLLALMGLTALLGVLAAGVWSDRTGPVWPTALAFAARIGVFALILVDQSPLSVGLFALIFGATFLVTAPLTVLFVRDNFGTRHLGALTGLITMAHHVSGGIGAYLGAEIFDTTGLYDLAFALALGLSVIALALTVWLSRLPVAVTRD